MKKRTVQKLIILLVVAVCGFIIISYNPQCVIKRFTGFPCVSCGMTRAFSKLLRGDIKAAFYYHPLFWLVPIIVFILIFKDGMPFSKRKYNILFWCLVVFLFILVYILRLTGATSGLICSL